jgi:DNA gyrase subunit B
VELVLTRLHAGGKFGGPSYTTSGGLHGVGASAVNALPHRMDVTVKWERQVYEISFAHGVPGVFDGPGPRAKFIPKSGRRTIRRMKRGESSGTSIRYWYDARYRRLPAELRWLSDRAVGAPAAFPNVLVNGTSGIAVGMATNMIPHNLGEVIRAARWLIRHPDASLYRLMRKREPSGR